MYKECLKDNVIFTTKIKKILKTKIFKRLSTVYTGIFVIKKLVEEPP